MFTIGERINGMFNDVRKGIETRNKRIIQNLARRQLDGGADALDINVGPSKGKPVDNMLWLIQTVQEVTNCPLCIDTPKFDVMQEALRACKSPTIINSTKATEEALGRYVPLAVETNSRLVALTIDAGGVPSDVDSRVMMGATIATKAMEGGLNITDVFIDPVILPINVAPQQPRRVLEAIRQLKMLSDPPPKFVLGLSNVSQGCKERSLINRIYLTMALAAGLDAAIADPTDRELMDAAITAELLMEKQIYCDDYIAAYMRSR
jgi:5-methyltetrahydrofolate corrinoid/iron sulfur protein methyltransferase